MRIVCPKHACAGVDAELVQALQRGNAKHENKSNMRCSERKARISLLMRSSVGSMGKTKAADHKRRGSKVAHGDALSET